jgi:hypothetical protein
MPPREAHHFDRTGTGPLPKSYLGKFSVAAKVCGEKTPKYMADPVAMVHISRTLPDVKLIVLLRDPVRRFYSHCRHMYRRPKSYRGMAKFITTRAGMDALWRGVYEPQLRLMYGLFPIQNIHIVFNEHLRQDTVATMNAMQEFIGVTPRPLTNNPGPEREFKNDSMRNELINFYAPWNIKLASLLDLPNTWHNNAHLVDLG